MAHGAFKDGLNPRFQLFDLPETDVVVESRQYVETPPMVMANINPMEFLVNKSKEYIDLDNSYFELSIKLVNANGGNIGTAENMFPTQNLAHTLIKQMRVYFNGILISAQINAYAYKAYIETLLNYNREETESTLRMQSIMPDAYRGLTASQKTTVNAMKAEKPSYEPPHHSIEVLLTSVDTDYGLREYDRDITDLLAKQRHCHWLVEAYRQKQWEQREADRIGTLHIVSLRRAELDCQRWEAQCTRRNLVPEVLPFTLLFDPDYPFAEYEAPGDLFFEDRMSQRFDKLDFF